MRQRLSWDKEKTAEIMKQADPYTMNQTRTNPPADKYKTGDPSEWGEGQNKETPWANEGRTETGHPAPAARQAVVQARKLEDKALKCITIAQRMLPGAEETIVEDQATDFMFMPERAIMATLQRQAELATKIAAECKDEDDKDGKKEDEEKSVVEAAKKEDDDKDGKKEEEVVEAAKKDEKPVEDKKEEEVVEAAKKEEPVEDKKEEKKEEDKPVEETPKEASDDLLDHIFDSAEAIPQEPKTGAKTLAGLVKQASTGSDPLNGLWDSPPDISSVFGRTR